MARALEARGAGAADAICRAGGCRRDRDRRPRRAQFCRRARRAERQRVRGGEPPRRRAAGRRQARRRRAVERRRARAHEPRARRPQARSTSRRSLPGRRRRRCRKRRSRSPCSASRAASRPNDAAVISEQDILGDRLVRPRRASRRAENFIAEVTSLAPGDLVVHVDHGIGRFVGLQAIEAAGAPHDCLEIHYAEAAKLYLPVENIDLLSRYGARAVRRRARPARRRQLAGAQGAHEEPHPRDGGRADQDRRRAAAARSAEANRRAGRLRRILRRVSLRGDRRPARGHRRDHQGSQPLAGRWTG